MAPNDGDDFIEWDLREPLEGYSSVAESFDCCMVPKTLAWCSFALEDGSTRVALVDGFNAAAMSPPTLMVAADALPEEAMTGTGTRMTLSVATQRERDALNKYRELERAAAATDRRHYSFEELGLEPHASREEEAPYPPAVALSPVHMHCAVVSSETLGVAATKKDQQEQPSPAARLLLVRMFVCNGTPTVTLMEAS